MSATKLQNLALKGVVSEMPEEMQKKVHECVEKLIATIAEYGDAGFMAMALVATEKIMEEEKKSAG